MLHELLTEPQRRLLEVLSDTNGPVSVLGLAQLTQVPYSTTHLTLRKLKKLGLVTSQPQSRRLDYDLNRTDAYARAFMELFLSGFPAQKRPDLASGKNVTDKDVLWNLAGLGAPLVVDEHPRKTLAPEQTFAFALDVAHRNPTAARALPVAFAKSLSRLNYPLLRYLSRERKQTRTLGFYLELTGVLSHKSRFKKLAAEFQDRRVKRQEPFFEVSTSKYAQALAHKRTPRLARKWHFLMNLDMDDFRSLFEKFYKTDAKIHATGN
ncbi:MAG: winged helix-turn-helix domain-containing protein [Pseudomonadota bacterium]